MDLDGKVYTYPTMSMAVNSSHLLDIHRELIDGLRERHKTIMDELSCCHDYIEVMEVFNKQEAGYYDN